MGKASNTLKLGKTEIKFIIRFYACIDLIPNMSLFYDYYFGDFHRRISVDWLFFRIVLHVDTLNS